jgi:hypothetical protein
MDSPAHWNRWIMTDLEICCPWLSKGDAPGESEGDILQTP